MSRSNGNFKNQVKRIITVVGLIFSKWVAVEEVKNQV